ncbi:unnamed protein product [Ilex paraguariensis]|uniref:Cation-transporting P-type ATPase N-terminal domain-containing protein n=1 Tax=Ilex paraguariensis TaxID=185542 RepID=A0ABC8STA9_9AQUA
MGTLKIFNIFTAHNHNHPTQSDLIRVSLLTEPSTRQNGLKESILGLFRRLTSGKKIDGGWRTQEDEKVYSRLYALALSEKDLVFEYVSSTERGLSFNEAERRLRENGPNIPHEYNFPRWGHLLWSALFHPFNIILIFLSAISYITSDSPNGCIMLVLLFISVSLRFCQEYSSSTAIIKLSELVRCPVRVQRCAGGLVTSFILFFPSDPEPIIEHVITTCFLNSQSSVTGESGTSEKMADIREDQSTPLLDLKNICFMVNLDIPSLVLFVVQGLALVSVHRI